MISNKNIFYYSVMERVSCFYICEKGHLSHCIDLIIYAFISIKIFISFLFLFIFSVKSRGVFVSNTQSIITDQIKMSSLILIKFLKQNKLVDFFQADREWR